MLKNQHDNVSQRSRRVHVGEVSPVCRFTCSDVVILPEFLERKEPTQVDVCYILAGRA